MLALSPPSIKGAKNIIRILMRFIVYIPLINTFCFILIKTKAKAVLGKRTGLLLTSQNAKDWDNQFGNLLRYRDIHGNCDVPTQGDAEFKSLGRWVSSQRKKYREFSQHQKGGSKDLHERFKRLDDIGFKFFIGSGRSQRKTKSAAPFT